MENKKIFGSLIALIIIVILIFYSRYRITNSEEVPVLLNSDALQYTDILIEPSSQNIYEKNEPLNFTFWFVNTNNTHAVNFTHWGEWKIVFYMPGHGIPKIYSYNPTIARGTRIIIEPNEREYIANVTYRSKYEGLTYIEIYIEGAGLRLFKKTYFIVH